MKPTTRLRPGDLVEVKAPEEILETLDSEGTLARLPFMPEMLEYCSRRFRVHRRVVKTCSYGTSSTMRSFPDDDVVILEGMRCDGTAHDGCQKACTIYWKEAWLRKVNGAGGAGVGAEGGANQASLRARLKTRTGPQTYFCQAGELSRAAPELSRVARFTKCFSEVSSGNCGSLEMVGRIATWLFWRVRRTILGPYGRGTSMATPTATLQLAPGELVQVKSMPSITASLNPSAYNRGLWFSPGMRELCGKTATVERRIEKLIVDGTGEMRQVKNTVYLEDSMCSCSHVAFGGCSRCEFNYWREIWLERPADSA
jgi:hypothetical protein